MKVNGLTQAQMLRLRQATTKRNSLTTIERARTPALWRSPTLLARTVVHSRHWR
jgi:hypothetical protein